VSSIIRKVHWAKNQRFVTVKTQDQIFRGKNWNAITSFHEADTEYCGPTFNVFFFFKSDTDKHYWSSVLGDYWYYFVVSWKNGGWILFSLGYFYIRILTLLDSPLAYTIFWSSFRCFVAGADCWWRHSPRGKRMACFINAAFILFRSVLMGSRGPCLLDLWHWEGSGWVSTAVLHFCPLHGVVRVRKVFPVFWCWDAVA